MGILKKALQPKIAIPVLLSSALLALVFSLADLPKVGGYLGRLDPLNAIVIFGLTIAYLVLKWSQFYIYLREIPLKITWRETAVAFAVGEMTLPIPAGIYAQNYVLQRIGHVDFARSSAATTSILVVEATLSLIVLAALGIPSWWWLRPAIVVFFFVAAIVAIVLLKFEPAGKAIRRLLHMGPLAKPADEILELVEETRRLFVPWVLERSAPLAAAYLLALVSGFFLLARSIGIQIAYVQAMTIYLFSVIAVELVPISSHLGVMEIGGVGAAEAWGLSWTEGLAMMLAFRLVWTASTWLVGLTTLFLLRGEFTQHPR